MKNKLKRGLIVSCQAVKGEPLHGYNIMPIFAKAAIAGGAVGIRALAEDIKEIKKLNDTVVVGLVKEVYSDSSVYITPTIKEAELLISTGCEVIAIDATDRKRPNNEKLEDIVKYIRDNSPETELLADIATEEDAIFADRLGFEYVSTTMRGYTEETKGAKLPDIKFAKRVKKLLKNSKLIFEGGVYESSDVKKISKLNPYALIMGSAITRPKLITEHFNKHLKLK